MNPATKQLLDKYNCQSTNDYENALREIFQELTLLGLWRAKFFEHAAFYGGTALRILHGLDRFSEDLDFSLLAPNPNFKLTNYCKWIEKELTAWGFPVTVEEKQKRSESNIESAFLKSETQQQMLHIKAPPEIQNQIQHNQTLNIKIEVDINPPQNFQTEPLFLLSPIPFPVKTYAKPSLFAGKMHALLCRQWGNRIKGRDWYDLVWYIAQNIPLDLVHLEARMRQTQHWTSPAPLTESDVQTYLQQKINSINFELAKKDAERFVRNPETLSIWSKSFFSQIIEKIQFDKKLS